jgi:hypothetical protein
MTPKRQNPFPRSVRIYRLLLHAYPAAFREAFGTEMLRVFQDSCGEEYKLHGRLRFRRFWLPAAADVLINALIWGVQSEFPKSLIFPFVS